MESHELMLPPDHYNLVKRFVEVCEGDERIVSAVLGGSYSTGVADEYSDLDLGLITTDESYDNFVDKREEFIRLLGAPVFVEDWGRPDLLMFTLDDGIECELWFGSQSRFNNIKIGSYKVLLDKQGILEGIVFSRIKPNYEEQKETLNRLIYWFWHDLSHFIAAIGRNQLWWGYGQLEGLRRYCVNLSLLDEDFSTKPENYDKLELYLPVEKLSTLKATLCPMETDAMLHSVLTIVQFYKEMAVPLAAEHGIEYPIILDRLLSERLNKVCDRLLD